MPDLSPEQWSHYTATVNGINIHYVMEGEGDPAGVPPRLARVLVFLAAPDTRVLPALPGNRAGPAGIRPFRQTPLRLRHSHRGLGHLRVGAATGPRPRAHRIPRHRRPGGFPVRPGP